MAVKPPLQERSRQTLESLLDATEALLAERDFEQISIADVVRHAGSSVGSFYARFPTKDDLFAALIARYHRQTREETAALLADRGFDERDLEGRARLFIRRVIAFCRRRRGLMRARLVRRIAPGAAPTLDESADDRDLVERLNALFAPVAGEIRHPDPGHALTFALGLVDGAVAHAILLDEVSASYGPLDDDALTEDLVRAFTGYLRGGWTRN